MHTQWLFLFLMPLAAATPASGQAEAPTVGPARTQGAAYIPDFFGRWSHPYWPGFEPPASGPGPVTNRLRLREGPQKGVSNPNQLVGDYTNPFLKPWAAEIVKQHGEAELNGLGSPTPLNQCWPEGVPFAFANFGMQLLQQPDKLTILYEHDHQVRRVRLNDSHPVQLTPSWYGDSVGHYEGDTLVVDTVGIKIGSFSMIDWYGTPYTHALHVVERYRLIDYEAVTLAEERAAKEYRRVGTSLTSDPNYKGKGLQLEFTVEDGGVFAMRWSATITYRRAWNEWPEDVCAESLHATYVDRNSAVPQADQPDF